MLIRLTTAPQAFCSFLLTWFLVFLLPHADSQAEEEDQIISCPFISPSVFRRSSFKQASGKVKLLSWMNCWNLRMKFFVLIVLSCTFTLSIWLCRFTKYQMSHSADRFLLNNFYFANYELARKEIGICHKTFLHIV